MTTPARGRPAVLPLALLLTVLLALAGCGGDDEPKSPRATAEAPSKQLTANTCWSDEQLPDALGQDDFDAWVEKYARDDAEVGDSMRDDAAFSEKIDCAEPHSLELYNVVELPAATAAQVKEYADLLDRSTPLYRTISDQVTEACMAGSPYDVAPRTARGLSVQLSPFLNSEGGLHGAWDPFPADLWAKGQRKFVCTFEQDVPGTVRFADITTSKIPLEARVCLNVPGTYVPCRGKHQAESLAELVVNTAIAKKQLPGRQAVRKGPKGPYVALSDPQFAKLDAVCQAFLSSVSTVRGGVKGRAYLGSPAQWPNNEGNYVASCFALKPFEPPPPITGTVFNRPVA
jgi:hypothetical protein